MLGLFFDGCLYNQGLSDAQSTGAGNEWLYCTVLYVYLGKCVHVCVYVCMGVLCVFVSMYMCMYVLCICGWMSVWIYVCMHLN